MSDNTAQDPVFDMLGRELKVGQIVLASQQNRPFPFRVVKLNPKGVTVEPAVNRRGRTKSVVPAQRYAKAGYNVYIIPNEDFFMFELKGRP